MLARQRQARVLDEVRRRHGEAPVSDLTRHLGVSDMTVRRVLTELARHSADGHDHDTGSGSGTGGAAYRDTGHGTHRAEPSGRSAHGRPGRGRDTVTPGGAAQRRAVAEVLVIEVRAHRTGAGNPDELSEQDRTGWRR